MRRGDERVSERAERVSHASGAGQGAPASERVGGSGGAKPPGFERPYVVSWNLTYRCNLACEHCYLDAGGAPQVGTENFADRSELGTEECFRVIDEIASFAPECLTILTGGEPLLRRDILEIVRRAAERELWVVVGTNGVRITENLAKRLAEAGARGLSLSLDALDRGGIWDIDFPFHGARGGSQQVRLGDPPRQLGLPLHPGWLISSLDCLTHHRRFSCPRRRRIFGHPPRCRDGARETFFHALGGADPLHCPPRVDNERDRQLVHAEPPREHVAEVVDHRKREPVRATTRRTSDSRSSSATPTTRRRRT